MSNQNATGREWGTVRRILAELILLAETRGLPEPEQMDANAENGCVGVSLNSRSELDAWADALGTSNAHSHPYSHQPGVWLHNAWVRHNGWFVSLSALTPDKGSPEPLDAETIAALEAVSA